MSELPPFFAARPAAAAKPIAGLAALILAPALASCAVAEAQSGGVDSGSVQAENASKQCFFPRQVTGFRNVEDDDGRRIDTRVLIDVGASDTYEFELLRRCPALRFARSIALEPTGAGRVCSGLDVDLIVDDTLGPERCRVIMVRKLPADDPNAKTGARD